VLIEAGLADAQDIEFALAEQRKRGGKRIGQILIEMKLISEEDLGVALARKFQLPFVDLDTCAINLEAVSELPREFIEKHRVLPVDSDPRCITVAMSDPLAVDSIDLVRLHSKKLLSEIVVTRTQLDKYIPTYLDQLDSKKRAHEMDEILKGLASGDAQALADVETAEASLVKESDNAVIKLANQIIIDAYRRGASDIHIEPNGKERTTTVRFRIDGDCVAYQDIPAAYRMPLVARIKIMAQLDIAERRKPQDGKIRFRVGERQIELRVATIPTVNNNEDIVLRILAGAKPLPLEQMGLSAHNLAELRAVISKPYGLVLCVGPTGSGKTTTLHSALGAINTIDTKIWTAEDPVEITQPGLRQVQVSPKIGFTFAAAMRAFLRADPDVIMVGEMRDQETAGTAIEASLTGHLVVSTLHTNSAPETVTRLIDMGLDPFSFADALLGILAQRLARSLCKQCREQQLASDREVEELAEAYGADSFHELVRVNYSVPLKLWRAVGCSACGNSGYKGRIGIHELLVADDALKRAIQHKASVDDLRRIATEGGMKTLLQDGIEKVLEGQTDLKQVLAVCSR
jgi:type II secretory ATPase GspE/PulE/Tfp pilus assembly ATPase PilB-like protein